jgi:hypothetical protein
MTTITAEAALAVVPFFAPLTIILCALLFLLARSQTETVRRVELLEQKAELWRPNGARAVRIRSPLAAAGVAKETGHP